MAIKIVKVAPVHVWDDVRVFHKEAVSLARSGFEVVLLSRSGHEREVEGVRVVPVHTSKRSRIVRFLMLPIVAIQAYRLKGDVYHLHNPDSIVVGVILKLLRKKVVYDSHEDFREKLRIRYWVPGYLRSLFIFCVVHLERAISRLSEFSITTQKEVAERFKGKVILLGNLPIVRNEKAREVSDIANSIKAELKDSEQTKRLAYIGYINRSRGLFEMIEALDIVNGKRPVRLWLIGPADESDIEQAQSLRGWQYVDYFDRLPQERAFAFVTLSDAGLVVIREEGGHAYTDPNKMYEYMRFGIPFIASNFELWKSKLGHVGAGVFVEPSSAELAMAITTLLDNPNRKEMGQKGQSYIFENNWDKDYLALEKAYKNLNIKSRFE